MGAEQKGQDSNGDGGFKDKRESKERHSLTERIRPYLVSALLGKQGVFRDAFYYDISYPRVNGMGVSITSYLTGSDLSYETSKAAPKQVHREAHRKALVEEGSWGSIHVAFHTPKEGTVVDYGFLTPKELAVRSYIDFAGNANYLALLFGVEHADIIRLSAEGKETAEELKSELGGNVVLEKPVVFAITYAGDREVTRAIKHEILDNRNEDNGYHFNNLKKLEEILKVRGEN